MGRNKKIRVRKNQANDVEKKSTPPARVVPPRQQPDNNSALQFIDLFAAKAPISRQQHIEVQAAVAQVGRALQQLEMLIKEKKDGKK